MENYILKIQVFDINGVEDTGATIKNLKVSPTQSTSVIINPTETNAGGYITVQSSISSVYLNMDIHISNTAPHGYVLITDGTGHTKRHGISGDSSPIISVVLNKLAIPKYGKIVMNGKDSEFRFDINGKTLTHVIYNNKILTLKEKNPYAGIFLARSADGHNDNPALNYPATASQVEHEYGTITTEVKPHQFFKQTLLTRVWLDKVTTIGKVAFEASKLVVLEIPEVISIGYSAFASSKLRIFSAPKLQTIGDFAFLNSMLTSLDLPEAISIGEGAFQYSLLTLLNIPKATTIGANSFEFIVNAATTHVTMKANAQVSSALTNQPVVSANTNEGKDRLFGVGKWDKITFTWV